MVSHAVDPYVMLHVRRAGDRSLSLDYRDFAGLTLLARRPDDAELLASIRALAAAAPPQTPAHYTGKSPVAIFASGDVSEDVLRDLEDLLAVQGVPRDDIQLVAMPHEQPAERLPFRFPLELAAIGPAAAQWVEGLKTRHWISSPEVKRYGCTIAAPAALPRARTKDLPDVVVLTDPAAAARIAKWDEAKRPRLIVAAGFAPQWTEAHRSSRAWIVLPDLAQVTPQAIAEILHAIVHDRPLHDVLKTMRRKLEPSAPRAYLIADPESNEGLRIWDAIVEVAETIAVLPTRLPPPGLRYVKWYRTPEDWDGVRWTLDDLRGSIGSETDGVVAGSKALSSTEQLEKDADEIELHLERKWKKRAERMAGTPRRVDVALMRTDPRTERTVFVQTNEALAASTRYRIRVHIGRPSAASIVTDDVPPIDPLLPPPPDERGHLLHVAVFPLDFDGQPQLQPLRLLPGRSSAPLYFDVVTPAAPMDRARLRIAVYYDADEETRVSGEDCFRNHLVQSFLLVTRVGAGEGWGDAGTTTVSLEFSRTTSFTNVEAFGGRALSIAVNESPDGTHALMLKRAGAVASVGVSQKFLQDQMDAVRAELWTASSADGSTPRFPTGEVGDEAAFDDAIRTLAQHGRELRQRFFGSDDGSGAVQALFRAVRERVDAPVQIVRLEQDFYFPWALLYDFPPPPVVAGAAEAPVCKGFERKNADGTPYSAAQCLSKDECLHPDKREVYCPYGFWGLRLQVEQTLFRQKQQDDAVPVLQPIRDGCVLVVTALDGDTAREFPKEMRTELGETLVAELAAHEKLVPKLWATDRPAIAVVLGHYQTKPVPGQRDAPRIAVAADDWLIADDILTQVDEVSSWSDPHTVVILAACESAGEDLVKMNGFVTAFAGARAGAVLGTEASVFESLARRFARSVTASLVKHGRTLGEAIVDCRRQLLQERNPLGLVFSAFGDVDLRRARETS